MPQGLADQEHVARPLVEPSGVAVTQRVRGCGAVDAGFTQLVGESSLCVPRCEAFAAATDEQRP